MKYIIRYEVCLSLGSGGATLGIYKTLDEAKASRTSTDNQIWKIWLQKNNRTGKFYRVHSERMV